MKMTILLATALLFTAGNSVVLAGNVSPALLTSIDDHNVEQLGESEQQSLRGEFFRGANAGNNASNWCAGRGYCFYYNSRGGVQTVDPYAKKKWGITYGYGVRYAAHR